MPVFATRTTNEKVMKKRKPIYNKHAGLAITISEPLMNVTRKFIDTEAEK